MNTPTQNRLARLSDPFYSRDWIEQKTEDLLTRARSRGRNTRESVLYTAEGFAWSGLAWDICLARSLEQHGI
jgi:hypothetical protein